MACLSPTSAAKGGELRGQDTSQRESPRHWLEYFRSCYGPVGKAFAALDPQARDQLEADLYALLDKVNVADHGTLVIPSEYLEAVVTIAG